MEKLGDVIGDVILVQLSVKKKGKKQQQMQGNQSVVSKVFDLKSERNDSQQNPTSFPQETVRKGRALPPSSGEDENWRVLHRSHRLLQHVGT